MITIAAHAKNSGDKVHNTSERRDTSTITIGKEGLKLLIHYKVISAVKAALGKNMISLVGESMCDFFTIGHY